MSPYRPPLEGRGGYLRLDFNENPRGAPPAVLDAVRRLTAEDLARYPEYTEVRAALARHLGLGTDQVLCTNASDEGIRIVCDAVVGPGAKVVLPAPTFAMFRFYAQLAGAEVVEVPYADDGRFSWPGEAFLAAARDPAVRLVVLVSPNNPTGTVVPREDVLAVIEAAPHACVLIDEAYHPIHGETALDLLPRGNVVVLRSFSKAFGLAGLRVGAIATSRENAAVLGKVASPYSVGFPGVAAVIAALSDPAYVSAYVRDVHEGLDELVRRLAARGLRHHRGAANFVLVDAGDRARCADLVAGLRARGVLVRDRSSDRGLAGWFRVSVGHRDDAVAFDEALGEALETRAAGGDRGGPASAPPGEAGATPRPQPARTARVRRTTRETAIDVRVALDGAGRSVVEGPIGFLNHMLEALARHGLFDLGVSYRGDLHTDQHHTLEDLGIVLGEAFRAAIGDGKGIVRAGEFHFPMEEALAVVAVDVAGRPQLVYDVAFTQRTIGELDVSLLSELFHGLARGLRANVHVRMAYGENDHHRCEAVFKALARALRQALAVEPRLEGRAASTKGSFD